MDKQLSELFLQLADNTTNVVEAIEIFQALPFSLLMGFGVYQLYKLYFQDNEPQDASLARSIIFITPTLTLTFILIQSSMSLSLGLLGSLSFIRFRTPIKRAEDVSFLLMSIAAAIACATNQYLAGFGLLGLLAVFAFIRNQLIAGSATSRFAIITFNTKKESSPDEILASIETAEVKSEFISARKYDGITSYVFNVSKIDTKRHQAIASNLESYDPQAQINIFYPNERLGA